MVDEPVDHGGGNGVVTEDFAPAPEGLVAGDDDRCPLVAGRDQLEEQVGGFGFEGQVADFVDDQHGIARQFRELLGEPACVVRVGEAGDPVGGGCESNTVSGVAGLDAERDGQVCFAGSSDQRYQQVGLMGSHSMGYGTPVPVC